MTLTCQWCDAEFTRPASRGPVPKWCSEAHRQAAYRHRREVAALTGDLAPDARCPTCGGSGRRPDGALPAVSVHQPKEAP